MADSDDQGYSSESETENMFSVRTRKTDAEIRMGYLDKRGQRNPAWRSRWFVLQGDQLLYFKSREATSPINAIRIRHSLIAESEGRRPDEYIFEIDTGTRLYFLRAQSEADMRAWIDVLVSRSEAHAECRRMDTLTLVTEQVERVKSAVDEAILADLSDVVGTLHSATACRHFGKFLLDHAESWEEYQQLLSSFREAVVAQVAKLQAFRDSVLREGRSPLTAIPASSPSPSPRSGSITSLSNPYLSSLRGGQNSPPSDMELLTAATAALEGSRLALASVTMPPSPLFEGSGSDICDEAFASVGLSQKTSTKSATIAASLIGKLLLDPQNHPLGAIPVMPLPSAPTRTEGDSEPVADVSTETSLRTYQTTAEGFLNRNTTYTSQQLDTVNLVRETNALASALLAGAWRSGPTLKPERSFPAPPQVSNLPQQSSQSYHHHQPSINSSSASNAAPVSTTVVRVPAALRALSMFWRSLASDPLTCALLPHGLVCLRLWLRLEELRLLSGPNDRWHTFVHILKPLRANPALCRVLGVTPMYFVDVAFSYLPRADIDRYFTSKGMDKPAELETLDDNSKLEILDWYLNDYGQGEDDPLIPEELPPSSQLNTLQRLIFLVLTRLHEAFRYSPSFTKALLNMPVYDNLELPFKFLQMLPTLDATRGSIFRRLLAQVHPSGSSPSDRAEVTPQRSRLGSSASARRGSVLIRSRKDSMSEGGEAVAEMEEPTRSRGLSTKPTVDREFWAALAITEHNRQCKPIALVSSEQSHASPPKSDLPDGSDEVHTFTRKYDAGLAGWRLDDAPDWLKLGLPMSQIGMAPDQSWTSVEPETAPSTDTETNAMNLPMTMSEATALSDLNDARLTAQRESISGLRSHVQSLESSGLDISALEIQPIPDVPSRPNLGSPDSPAMTQASDDTVSPDLSSARARSSKDQEFEALKAAVQDIDGLVPLRDDDEDSAPATAQASVEDTGFLHSSERRRAMDAAQLMYGATTMTTRLSTNAGVASTSASGMTSSLHSVYDDEEDEHDDGAFFGEAKDAADLRQEDEKPTKKATPPHDPAAHSVTEVPATLSASEPRRATSLNTKTTLEQELDLGEDIDVDNIF